MHPTEKKQHRLIVLNFILTALILLGVIIVAGWLLMLDQRVNELSNTAGQLAIQLTLQSTLAAYQEEIAVEIQEEVEPQPIAAVETEEPVVEATLTATATPKPNELNFSNFQEIKLILNPRLDELSDLRYFRLPPLSFSFPQGWGFRYNSTGTLTVIDSFGNETTMRLHASNTRREFILNEIGTFTLQPDGTLSWYPDTAPRQGLGAGDYQLFFTIDDYTSEPVTITVEDAPMARILESIPMYRTYEDIVEDRRYLSFASQQEPMSMYGYMVVEDGSIFIRVWRSHDKFYYWVKGNYVMHPDEGLLYNDRQDLLNPDGTEIIPEIDLTVN
ncbi:MAG: hypothetical protein V2J07_01335 [Anaerolineae bacterium]|jgi:hypothetical protein|nr:hypothetical protein [Anaerolineae bacterium]